MVRISMDLSVCSLVFVNSTATFRAASMNLKLKVFFMFLSAVIIFFLSRCHVGSRRDPSQQAGEEISQLVEVVRLGDVYIFANSDLSPLGDLFKAEDNNRHIGAGRGTFADTTSGTKDFA